MRALWLPTVVGISPRNWRFVLLSVLLIGLNVVCLVGLFLWDNNQSHLLGITTSPPSSSPPLDTAIDLSLPDAPFIAWPLARVCAEATATTAAVFVCDNNSGGIGNIRNFVLTCLRYAIAAGARGLVLPTVQTRRGDLAAPGDLFRGERVPFGHFFDEAWFRAGLRAACPELVVYDDLGSVHMDGEQGQIEMITPKHFGMRGGCDGRDLNRHTDLFGARFRAWLAERQQQQHMTTTKKLVRFNWGVQWEWPVHRDGPELAATFGGLLRFRADLLVLGQKTVQGLAERRQQQKQQQQKGGFLGVHLRTEEDALGNWPSFDEQAGAYLAVMAARQVCLAYVATGNASEAARFAALARQRFDDEEIEVVTKHHVLGDGPLDGISWDQQAVVDFVVLLHADWFVGTSPSSFSINVALKRHLGGGEGLHTRPWRVGGDEGDGRSWLVGRYENYWEDWLFMYDSLWP